LVSRQTWKKIGKGIGKGLFRATTYIPRKIIHRDDKAVAEWEKIYCGLTPRALDYYHKKLDDYKLTRTKNDQNRTIVEQPAISTRVLPVGYQPSIEISPNISPQIILQLPDGSDGYNFIKDGKEYFGKNPCDKLSQEYCKIIENIMKRQPAGVF